MAADEGNLVRGRRERRLLRRVSRACRRFEQARLERSWAVVSAAQDGLSVRRIAAAAVLSSSRVQQLLTQARAEHDVDQLLAGQLGELRLAGWPDPEDPDGSDDEELAGRDLVADRLVDEVVWLRRIAEWFRSLSAGSPVVVNLRPEGDWPHDYRLGLDHDRVIGVLERVTADIEELARARRVQELRAAAVLDDPRAERRRRLAEPDLPLKFVASTSSGGTRARWEAQQDAWQAERRARGETDPPG